MSVRLRERLSASHRDTTGAIGRATATLLITCMSVVILSGVDDTVILGDKTVSTPFVGQTRYKLFLYLAPLFITALRIYIDLQLAYLGRLTRIVKRYAIGTSLSLTAANNIILWVFGAAAIHLGPPATIVVIGYHASAFYPEHALLLYLWAAALLLWSAVQIVFVLKPRRPWFGVATLASVVAGILVVAIAAREDVDECERRYDGFAPAVALDLLRGAELSRADLTGGFYPDANFSCSEMESSIFQQADVKFSRFWFAYVKNARFSGSIFSYAEFDGADVLSTDLTASNGSFAQFFETRLDQSDFSKSNLTGAKFNHSTLDQTVFETASLPGSSFYKAELSFVRFAGANLNRANFDSSILIEVDFSGADLRETTFNGTQIDGGHFKNADLRCASFAGATLDGVDFSAIAPGGLAGVELPDQANMTEMKWPAGYDPKQPQPPDAPSCE